MGHVPELVDYRPLYYFPKPSRFLGYRPSTIKRNIISRWRWYDFKKRFLPMTKRRYFTAEDLQAHPPKADVYVCGSDQIWNTKHLGRFDANFFLGFVPRHKPRIAYGPSLGGDGWREHREEIRKELRKFLALSVRESSGAKLVEDLAGRQVHSVLDPTLLKDDYESLAPYRTGRGEYILTYAVQDSDQFAEEAQMIAGNIHLPVVNVVGGGSDLPWALENVRGVGPAEFLGLIRGASAVVTNSYHGMIFSILFRKPFHVVRLEGSYMARQTRQNDLLSCLRLQNISYDNSVFRTRTFAERCFQQQYGPVHNLLAHERARSLFYLQKALEIAGASSNLFLTTRKEY